MPAGPGTLILLGTTIRARRPGLGFALVVVGCIAGAVATMWTLVVPLLAVALIVLMGLESDGRRTDRLAPRRP